VIEKSQSLELGVDRNAALASVGLYTFLAVGLAFTDQNDIGVVIDGDVGGEQLADFVEAHSGKERDERHPKPSTAGMIGTARRIAMLIVATSRVKRRVEDRIELVDAEPGQ